MSIRRTSVAAWIAAVLLSSISATQASPYTAEYVFGDNLSDNGNLAEVFYHQNFPNPPSYHDSFTNGPVAVAQLGGSLGLTVAPSLWVTGFSDTFNLFGGPSYSAGTNYAVGGATAQAQAVGGSPGINLPQQVGAFNALTAAHADPNALYVIMIGSNDVRDATLNNTGAPAISTGVATEIAAVQTLADEGASNLLVVNVPDIGATPEFALNDPSLAHVATDLTQLYNASLAAGLTSLSLAGLKLFDLYGFNMSLLDNAASNGLSDTTNPCFVGTPLTTATTPQCGPNGVNIGDLAYWDPSNPSGTVHTLWADGLEAAIDVAATPVAEPASIAILGVGVVGVMKIASRGKPDRSQRRDALDQPQTMDTCDTAVAKMT
jgi:phospholipase/lecithinase/hemolysin